MEKTGELTKEEELLMGIYQWGFDDELDGLPRIPRHFTLASCAYDVGRSDAIVGDDISSIDEESNYEKLTKITDWYERSRTE